MIGLILIGGAFALVVLLIAIAAIVGAMELQADERTMRDKGKEPKQLHIERNNKP